MLEYDLLIKNVRIVDGTGNPWFRAVVGIVGNKISYVGSENSSLKAKHIIDGKDKILAPGFIDSHTHCDYLLFREPTILSKLKQGVTTIMIGACGISPAPIKKDKVVALNTYTGFVRAGVNIDYTWQSFGEYLSLLDTIGLGQNVFAFVGHGTIRLNAMGFDERKATDKELDEMKRLLRESMSEGAFGMTTGLIYPPGVYSDTEELIEISKELKSFNGIYMSHMRNESNSVVKSVLEVIDIAKKAGIAVQLHHHKTCGVDNWGLAKKTIELLKNARKEGVDITIDQYPYTVASTTMRALLPPWANEGGVPAVIERLSDKDKRAKIKDEILNTFDWDNYYKNSNGAKGVIIMDTPATPEYEGKTLEDVANLLKKDPLETAFDLIIANGGSDNCGYNMMDDKDVKHIMKQEFTMIGSDSIHSSEGAKCHPRVNGTFPRVISRYARDKNIFSLETAINKMTGLTASRFNLKTKGLIKENMDADLVLFDYDTIEDKATFENPFDEPIGIHYVIVNGGIVLENGNYTGIKNGKVLRNN